MLGYAGSYTNYSSSTSDTHTSSTTPMSPQYPSEICSVTVKVGVREVGRSAKEAGPKRTQQRVEAALKGSRFPPFTGLRIRAVTFLTSKDLKIHCFIPADAERLRTSQDHWVKQAFGETASTVCPSYPVRIDGV